MFLILYDAVASSRGVRSIVRWLVWPEDDYFFPTNRIVSCGPQRLILTGESWFANGDLLSIAGHDKKRRSEAGGIKGYIQFLLMPFWDEKAHGQCIACLEYK